MRIRFIYYHKREKICENSVGNMVSVKVFFGCFELHDGSREPNFRSRNRISLGPGHNRNVRSYLFSGELFLRHIRMSYILFPELVDHIFEYLNDRSLYACLFVSQQFNEHAARLLYRHLRFDGGFTDYYSNESHKLQVVTRYGETDKFSNIKSRNRCGKASTGDLLLPDTSRAF